MQISDFLVKKMLVSITFCGSLQKKLHFGWISFKQHEEFQITLSLCVQLLPRLAKPTITRKIFETNSSFHVK